MVAPCKCASRDASTGQPLQPDRGRAGRPSQVCECSAFRTRSHSLWTAHPCRASLPSTVLALTPRCTARAGGRSQLNRPAARPRFCTAKALLVRTHAFPSCTLCARSLSLRRAASPHPALTHRRPPHSAGRYLCNGITLDGTAPHRAHRHAPRASASRASSPRSMAPRSMAPRATAPRSTRSAFASSRWLCL